MTKAYDVKQLIAEQTSGVTERLALEDVAQRLEDRLSAEVPYRPAFKVQLREQLIAQARQQMTPWYRRRAFLGSFMAVATAAAVLVVGLNLWQRDGFGEVPLAVQPPGVARQSPPDQPPNLVTLVASVPADLTQPTLPDERREASAVQQGQPTAEAQSLQLKQLTARPSEEEFRAMATRLAFRGESRRVGASWAAEEGSRQLTLTDEGQVGYIDASPVAQTGATIDADGARQAAFRFLDQALLPVHTGQPEVRPEGGGYTVIYEESVEGRPVVNAKTIVRVNNRGSVERAEAYVASGVTVQGTYLGVTEAEAVAAAQGRGGNFQRADLVWVRTPGEGSVYLQPYWRAYGTDSQGAPIVRYIPALKR